MKIMFLDESGDHDLVQIDNSYPVFVLAGCIFDFDYYSNVVEPETNKLKEKHFGKTNIILRSYDIRRQRNDFAGLVDTAKRQAFQDDLDNLLSSLEYVIIAAAIDKNGLKSKYTSPVNPYHLCLQFILERSVMCLGRTGEKMIFRIESRQTHNDKRLAEVYEDFRQQDHRLFKKEEIQSKIVDLSFNQKDQNIVGMQISDLIAYPIGRKVLNKVQENKTFGIVEKKFHKNPRNDGEYVNYGLKIFP